MPSPSKRLMVCVLFLTALCSTALHLLQGGTPQVKKASRSVPPRPAPRVEAFADFNVDPRGPVKPRRLDGRTPHRYSIDLKSGQVFEAVIEQAGVDVQTSVITPTGPLFEVDSLSQDYGAERIFFVAKFSGVYQLQLWGSDPKGTYTLKALAIRKATSVDQEDAKAEELFYNARRIKKKQPDRAAAQFLEAAEIWQRLGNAARRANALERIVAIQVDRKKGDGWAKTLEDCRQSLALYEGLGDQRAQARVHVQLGFSYRSLGDLERAKENYRQALQIAKSLNILHTEWEGLVNMAVADSLTGDYWQSLDLYDRALELAGREQNTIHKVTALLGRSLIWRSLGKYGTAEEDLKAAWKLGSKENVGVRAQIETRFSELYNLLDRSDLALIFAKQSLEHRRQAEDERGQAVTLSSISLIQQSLGDSYQARKAAEEALVIFRRLSLATEEATANINLGNILLDQEDAFGAIDLFSRGLRLARDQKDSFAEVGALYALARAERMRGDRISALRYLEELLRILETMTRLTVRDDDQGSFLRTRHRSYELLTDLLVRSDPRFTSPRDVERAFEATESSDWRTLLEELQVARVRWRLHALGDAVRLDAVWSLHDQIKNMEARRALREERGESTTSETEELERLEEKLRTAETQLRRNDPAGIPDDIIGPVSLKETQAMLGNDTALLRFQLGEERSFLFFVTSTTAEVYTLPPKKDLENDAHRLYTAMASRSLGTEEMTVRRIDALSDKLLRPVAGRLGGKRLVIVPDGPLQAVPFVLVPESSSSPLWKGRWREPLILRHEVVVLPSVSVLNAIRRVAAGRRPPKKLLAVLSNPALSSKYAALPHSDDEARRISLVVGVERTLQASGRRASLRLAASEALSGYRILHFATHAENHPEIPQLSSIILSQFDAAGRTVDGELRFNEIRNLYFPADLVVLSACETALGDPVEGEGWVGLGHGFLYAGSSRVVSSLWNVNDQSTPELMEQFYRGMFVDHLSPSKALRKAQLWMAERRSPYYWAGFQIQGEWR